MLQSAVPQSLSSMTRVPPVSQNLPANENQDVGGIAHSLRPQVLCSWIN